MLQWRRVHIGGHPPAVGNGCNNACPSCKQGHGTEGSERQYPGTGCGLCCLSSAFAGEVVCGGLPGGGVSTVVVVVLNKNVGFLQCVVAEDVGIPHTEIIQPGGRARVPPAQPEDVDWLSARLLHRWSGAEDIPAVGKKYRCHLAEPFCSARGDEQADVGGSEDSITFSIESAPTQGTGYDETIRHWSHSPAALGVQKSAIRLQVHRVRGQAYCKVARQPVLAKSRHIGVMYTGGCGVGQQPAGGGPHRGVVAVQYFACTGDPPGYG